MCRLFTRHVRMQKWGEGGAQSKWQLPREGELIFRQGEQKICTVCRSAGPCPTSRRPFVLPLPSPARDSLWRTFSLTLMEFRLITLTFMRTQQSTIHWIRQISVPNIYILFDMESFLVKKKIKADTIFSHKQIFNILFTVVSLFFFLE